MEPNCDDTRRAVQAVARYRQLCEALYQRSPRDLGVVNGGWVRVDGAQMRVADLEQLTVHLAAEHHYDLTDRRAAVHRLVSYFSQGEAALE